MVLLAVGLVSGCGDSTSSPPVVGRLQAAGPLHFTGTVGEPLTEQLAVRVVDAAGQGVAGVDVSWSATSGGGSVAPTRSATDASGIARADWTLGPVSGSQAARAALGSAQGVEFTAAAGAGPAATLVLTPTALNLTAVGDTSRMAVSARDRFGNETAAGALTWSSSADAVAVVEASLVRAVAPGTAVIAAAAGAVRGEAQVSVSQVPASVEVTPASLSFGSIGESAQVSGVVRDRNGVPLQGAAPAWSSRSDVVAAVDLSGRVTATGPGSTWIVGAQGSAADSVRVVVSQVPASLVAVSGSGGQQPAGSTRRLTARVLDAGGAGIAGVAVAWSSAAGSVTALDAVTDATGTATADWMVGTVPGTRQASAVAAGLAAVPFTAAVVAGPASPATSIITVANSTLLADGAASTAVTVQLRDAWGNPHTTGGTHVTISATGGTLSAGGASGASVTASDLGNGSYSAVLTAATTAGTVTVSAAAAGQALDVGATVEFRAGAPASLVHLAGDGLVAAAGAATTTPPSVRVLDAHGNPVPGAQVTFSVTTGGGSLGGQPSTVSVADASGIATAATWTVGTVAGSAQQVTAVAGAAQAVFTATVTPAAAAGLAIATQPSAGSAGVAFATQPSLRLVDAFGNTVPQAGVGVQAHLTQAGVLLGSVWATTTAAGLATFADLAIGGSTGNYTLTFSASGLAGATTGAIALGHGVAARLEFVSGGGWVAAAGSIRLVEARVTDTWGNAVPGYPVSWEVADAAFGTMTAGGLTGPTVTGLTNASGVAQAWWNMPPQVGAVSAYASAYGADGLPLPLSPWRYDAMVVPAEPAQLAIIQQPSSTAPDGAVFARQPIVELQDQYGNRVSQVVTAISVSLASGTGTLQGTTGGLTTDGRLTFTDLRITGSGPHVLRFTSGDHTPVTSAVVQVVP